MLACATSKKLEATRQCDNARTAESFYSSNEDGSSQPASQTHTDRHNASGKCLGCPKDFDLMRRSKRYTSNLICNKEHENWSSRQMRSKLHETSGIRKSSSRTDTTKTCSVKQNFCTTSETSQIVKEAD